MTVFYIPDILREKLIIICTFLIRVNFNQIFPTEEKRLLYNYNIYKCEHFFLWLFW